MQRVLLRGGRWAVGVMDDDAMKDRNEVNSWRGI